MTKAQNHIIKNSQEADNMSVRCFKLMDLPDDLIFYLCRFCGLPLLGTLSRVCKRLNQLLKQDCVWIPARTFLSAPVSSPSYDDIRLPFKDQCRISLNWIEKSYKEKCFMFRSKEMPCIDLDRNYLWVSQKNTINCLERHKNGHLKYIPSKCLKGHSADISRFKRKNGRIISGARDGSICCFETESSRLLWQQKNAHESDIHAVDFHDDLIVSGSRNAMVKIWRKSDQFSSPQNLLHTLLFLDRVWSLSINPSGSSFCIGTACINELRPLQIVDSERGQVIRDLGTVFRKGAGVLDIQYETQDIVFSCGYDTFIRLWDLRTPGTKSVQEWEEPFDSTIYCLKSDGEQTFVSGQERHGMSRLWDRRKPEPIQMYYVGRTSSPVYSLAFDSSHLYVALDKGIHTLDFNGPRKRTAVSNSF